MHITYDSVRSVVAVGVRPAIEFAVQDFEIDPKDGAIVVNRELQARSDVYAVRTTM
jgi:NADPH-dependent 2,4-dienoyl-CoA reductase/sulfur reductase-like enzyme